MNEKIIFLTDIKILTFYAKKGPKILVISLLKMAKAWPYSSDPLEKLRTDQNINLHNQL